MNAREPKVRSEQPEGLSRRVELFRQVVAGMDQGVVLTDAGQKVVFSNAYAHHLFGFDPTGRPVSELTQWLVSAAGDPELPRGEVLVTKGAQGRQTRCYLNIAPLSRSGDQVQGLVWTFFELTDEMANTRVFLDFAAEIADMARALKAKETELLRLSRTDPLTGAAHRQAIVEVVERAVGFASARSADLAVIAFDVDHFEKLNATKGLRFGDEILRHIATGTTHELGAVGTLGRWSGDSFLVVLPGADKEQARSFAEQIRSAVQRETRALELPLTVTLGVACLGPSSDSEALITSAWRAVAQGKGSGRNSVVIAD